VRRRWEYYTGPGGREVVIKDIKNAKLTLWEAARLEDLMERAADDRLFRHDITPLRDGVNELRLDGDHRIFRLAYAEVNVGAVLLALHFFPKKKMRDGHAVNLAVKRFEEWRRRQ
jgi:hypothetical protein